MKKQIASLLLANMVVTNLVGCSSPKPAETTAAAAKEEKTSEAQTETSVPAEPVKITIGLSTLASGFPDDKAKDYVYQTILDRTGVDVEFVVIDDYYTALNVRLTGSNAPDMFKADMEHMQVYASQGLLKDLTDVKDQLKPVFEHLGPEYDNYTLYSGDRMYALPAANALSSRYYALYVRQDYLDEYGLKKPTTVDELYDYCMTVKEKDPVGGGQTIPFTGDGWNALDILANPYDVAYGNHIIIRDGQVTNTLLQPGMTDALEAAKKFWSSGLVDPDIFAKKLSKEHTLGAFAGASVFEWANVFKEAYVKQIHEVNPNAEYIWTDPLKKPDGTDGVYGRDDYNFNGQGKFVVNADITDEKLDAIVRLLNYMATDEGEMLVYVGLENEHWSYDSNGNVVINEEKKAETNYTNSYQLIGRNDPVYLELKFPEAAEVVDFTMNMDRYLVYDKTIMVPETYYLDDLNTYVNDQMLAFIKGERPIEEYDAFVDELYSIYDLQTYMDIASSQLTEMGLAEK